jgi:integrase
MPRIAHPWFRRSDGWWYIKINGKQVKLAHGRESRHAAAARWHDLQAERAKNPPLESPDPTVASIIDTYLTHSKRATAASTYAMRLPYLQSFAEAHGFRVVRECRPIHATTWLDDNPQWFSDWTRCGAATIVQRPFNWAVKQGLLTANPFRGVTHRPGLPRRPLTNEEFRSLLRATNGPPRDWKRKRPTTGARCRQVLLFLRYTGARPCEMSRLTWDEVDLAAGVIILRQHKTSRTQRTPKPRVIVLVPAIVKLLEHIKSQQPAGETRVFLNCKKKSWNKNSLTLMMRRCRTRSGIADDAKLYGIRHQFGTQAILNGVDLRTLSELMGHTSTRMTEHYTHLAGQAGHLAAAMQRAVSRR